MPAKVQQPRKRDLDRKVDELLVLLKVTEKGIATRNGKEDSRKKNERRKPWRRSCAMNPKTRWVSRGNGSGEVVSIIKGEWASAGQQGRKKNHRRGARNLPFTRLSECAGR